MPCCPKGGSSPRVRGTRRALPRCGRPKPGHPRGCGEHRAWVAAEPSRFGSSPRVRGTRRWCWPIGSSTWVIPAGAGNTWGRPPSLCPAPGHPRGCGEHTDYTYKLYAAGGSSPRVRGTRIHLRHQRFERRVIPAGAGNTDPHAPRPLFDAGHPRGCGEHGSQDGSASSFPGHPRGCGEHGMIEIPEHDRLRVIPAGAGNTPRNHRRPISRPGHPRGCGEHSASRRRYSATAGSSPRVRGTLQAVGTERDQERVIPAGAGNTRSRPSAIAAATGHPRGCGEHCRPHSPRLHRPGSSPRVRGTRLPISTSMPRRRVIPAGAGNTLAGTY
ncbi:hypothetical protein SAMN05421751_11928 [Jhaorihella thermophila]|uniref:Uncharacterized protein n=1 Tax=Jhaorihella thermophila TaxID=488547 RepID=A0A1H5YKG8_9RHOB|nr:hypothetical protein SAMN05421751_11928 [Jhaorihella thermophila]